MATIYANTSDGYAEETAGSINWDTAHDNLLGDAVSTSDTDYKGAVHVSCVVAGRGATYKITRALMDFDTSGISVAPSAATLKIYGITNNTADLIVIKALHNTASPAVGWFSSFEGYAAGRSPWGSGDVTTYSSQISTWSTSGYNDIVLNSTALSDMASLSTFKIMIMEHDHDYSDVTPGGARTGCISVSSGMYFADNTGTSKDPYIDYTPAGYGNLVLGVASGDIATVNGVATADISKVNGV